MKINVSQNTVKKMEIALEKRIYEAQACIQQMT